MTTTAAPAGDRKTISIHDYPEHLNPFREDDNHNKIRFWTIGRKLNRSNSISFSGIKELKNSWAFRSFMRKGKKGQQTSLQEPNSTNHVNGESPVVFRRALHNSSTSSTLGARSTVGSPERADRYVYGGSVTPLPRSRFQERLRTPSQHEVNSLSVTPRMARSDVTGSRLSVDSTNPFDECPVPPVRASRRKKKRAPPPPPGTADVSISSVNSELHISESEEKKVNNVDAELETDVINANIELKIIEDDDVNSKATETTTELDVKINDKKVIEDISIEDQNDKETKENENDVESTSFKISKADSEDDLLDKVSFPKIDIIKYRRNSSLNEDDIRLRRGNLEDFHQISGKRSKSLTNNALDSHYITYDIDFNENRTEKDPNGNREPQKVICKLYNETSRKQSIDNSVSSAEKEFIEIDKATRELEREINKLNSALSEDDNILHGAQLSVSEIRRKFDNPSSPNPIPKPRRSHYGGSNSPVNGE